MAHNYTIQQYQSYTYAGFILFDLFLNYRFGNQIKSMISGLKKTIVTRLDRLCINMNELMLT